LRLNLPRTNQVLNTVLYAVGGLIGVGFGTFAFAPPTDGAHGAESLARAFSAFTGILGVVMLWLSYRQLRASIVITPTGVVVRRSWRKIVVPHADVDGFVVQPGTTALPLVPFWIVGVRLRSGKLVLLREVRSLSRVRMERAAERGNQLMRGE
jgi:hypothetical protein